MNRAEMAADERIRFSCDFGDEGISVSNMRSWTSTSSRSTWSQRGASMSEGYASSASGSFSAVDGDGYVAVDSLTLALEELRSGQPTTNFLETHQRLGDSSSRGSYEFLEVQKRSYKRSSSLKTKKTPPGTPNQMKKAVRFADAFGLDLAFVRHVVDLEKPPEIPPHATRHLDLPDSDSEDGQCPKQEPRRQTQSCQKFIVSPRFAQPGDSVCFCNRVAAQKVLLERANVTPSGSVEGLVRVANLAFEKEVTVRATCDNWCTVQQCPARHASSSCDGATDQFGFELPAEFNVGTSLMFCIRYTANGETFWDNNFGENYSFDCYTVNAPVENCE